MNKVVEDIANDLNLNDAERAYLGLTNNPNQTGRTTTIFLSNIYLAKKLQALTIDIINSNEKLAASNEKFSKAMIYLTAGLVFVGIVQIALGLFN